MVRTLLAAAMMLGFAIPAVASEPLQPYTLSGAGLYDLCQGYPSRCIEYIEGAIAAFELAAQGTPLPPSDPNCSNSERERLGLPCFDLQIGAEDASWIIEQAKASPFRFCKNRNATDLQTHNTALNASAAGVVFSAINWGLCRGKDPGR
jgi:hypothetical protein